MAEKTPIYLDFENGEVVEFSSSDTIPAIHIPGVGGTFEELSDGPGDFTGQAGKFIKVNAGETALEYATLSGGGDLLAANNLSDVASAATARSNLGLAIGTDVLAPNGNGSSLTGLTKSQVGLGNVDNTSDANKPVSTAQQTAIDAKVADAINNGTTTIAPSQNAVFDALALKLDASSVPVKATGAETDTGTDDAKFLTPKAIEDSSYIKAAYADAKVADAINNGTTTVAPSQNAVFDALALKADITSLPTAGQAVVPFATSLQEDRVTISHTGVSSSYIIIASIVADNDTNLNESWMAPIICNFQTDSFDILLRVSGGYHLGQVLVNYYILTGTPP